MQRASNYTADETFQKIKMALSQEDATVLSERPPTELSFRQGSLWGIMPRTAKKTVQATLKESEGKTVVTFESKLAGDWVNITLVGCALAAVLAAACLWMATDLSTFLITGNPSVWSWIVTSGSRIEFQAADAFVNLAYGLAIFLFVIIAVEAAVYVYAKKHVDATAEAILLSLT